jgi:hypothetical protein
MITPQCRKTLFGRRQGPLRGWIPVHGRRYLPCTARSMSPRGALLEVEQLPTRLPFRFRLAFDAWDMTFDCEVRNIGLHVVSVLFEDDEASSADLYAKDEAAPPG